MIRTFPRSLRLLLAFAMLVMFCAGHLAVGVAQAAPSITPRTMSYQGVLTDDVGDVVPDASYTIVFRIYNDPTGGSALWSESLSVATTDGVFDATLGTVTPLAPSMFTHPAWLSIEIEGQAALTPRTELTTTPYSFLAAGIEDEALSQSMIPNGLVVRSLNGVRDHATLQAGSNVSISTVGQDITISATGGTGGDDGDWTLLDEHLFRESEGTVAIGTADPEAMTTGQTLLQVTSDLWPAIALDRAAPNFQRWLMLQEGINNNLLFTHASAPGTMGTPVVVMRNNGNVGIGTTNPLTTLDVFGGDGDLDTTLGDMHLGNGLHHFRMGIHTAGVEAGEVNLRAMSASGTPVVNLGIDDHDVVSVKDESFEFFGNAPDLLARIGSSGTTEGGTLDLYGHVPTVRSRISFDAQNGTNATLFMRQEDGQNGLRINSGSGTSGGEIVLYDGNGVEEIRIAGTYGGGPGRVRTPTLEITGGADLSEQFVINFDDQGSKSELEPGMVVVVDVDNPGELTMSSSGYDRRVAGVISGAGGVRPGMLMGQQGSIADGEYPVALTGRVYVQADAGGGSIEPGDLLTTSDLPGHAMKVTDHSRAVGAILGKAMTRLESGRGLVLVLVSLQ